MELIGLVAACLTTISFLPQAAYIFKTKDTSGVNLIMYSMLVLGVCLWLIYGIQTRDVSIILANGISLMLQATILAYKLKYR